MAAIASRIKKIIETRLPNGIPAKTAGSTLNTRLGPSAGSSPIAKTAGKMTMPTNSAIIVSKMTTYAVAEVRFSSSGR